MRRKMRAMGRSMTAPAMDPRSRFFLALSSDQRLKLIELLKEKEKNLSELTKELNIDVSVVSRHLMMLRNLGIVSTKKDKGYLYFFIADNRIFDLILLTNQIVSDWFKHNQKMFG